MMTKEEMASGLDGRPFTLARDVEVRAREGGLVIVCAAEDDLLEFYGAIRNGVCVSEGAAALLDAAGVLDVNQVPDKEEAIDRYIDRKARAWFIRPARGAQDGDAERTLKTDIPHAPFRIKGSEGSHRGMVFSLADLR